MHVHTSDSPDAEIPAWELVRRAEEKGISVIGFVAHLDLNPDDYCYGYFSSAGYDASIREALSVAGEGTTVLKGLEVGEPHRFGDQASEMVGYQNYDFITGALHYVEGAGMILGPDVFREKDPMHTVREYYEETLRMVESSDMDILAHMGLFRRGLAMAGLDFSFDETELWPDLLRTVLRTLIRRGIVLELNTSGLRRPEKTTYPAPGVMELYRELGGELVTIGSDSHRDPHVFFGLHRGREILIDIGFTSIYSVKERSALPHPLV